ncbi:four helix bundle protein [Candidatus Parcubacteria bacterium]|nr:MAG: four helix bundle protein [Candidatus Parcubacteria bacterium]
MPKTKSANYYDLEDRTFAFARDVRLLVRRIKKDICNLEDSKQLVRSSGSVGANYIEANESLSKKDFIHRIKISRKEAKESTYWLKLINFNEDLEIERKNLIKESIELTKIFGSIIEKCK